MEIIVRKLANKIELQGSGRMCYDDFKMNRSGIE
jgi:hypothetical protein